MFAHESFVLAWFLEISKHNVWVSQSILLQLLPMKTPKPNLPCASTFVRQSRTFHSKNARERERDRLVQAHQRISSVFFTLGTRLRIDFCKKSDRTRCLAVSILEYNINSNSKSAERAKACWFSEGRTK